MTMTTVHLRDWDRFDGWWELCTDTAEIRKSEIGSENGWLHVRDTDTSVPPFFAIYCDGRGLWLQAGIERWPVDGLTFSRESDPVRIQCRFRATRGTDVVIDHAYLGPLSDPINQADPSFDALDEELLDFFQFLAVNGNDEDWRAHMLRRWSLGGMDCHNE
jgi:hypothetical protein